MDNNRSDILSQLASGQISADQAAEQLRGPAAPAQAELPAPRIAPPPVPEPSAAPARRWLHVRVSEIESGRQRVSVNLPLSWLSLGLRIGARFSPEVAALDPNDLIAALQSGASGPVVDVEDLDDGERVQIFVE